jgi:hypothetical protein
LSDFSLALGALDFSSTLFSLAFASDFLSATSATASALVVSGLASEVVGESGCSIFTFEDSSAGLSDLAPSDLAGIGSWKSVLGKGFSCANPEQLHNTINVRHTLKTRRVGESSIKNSLWMKS